MSIKMARVNRNRADKRVTIENVVRCLLVMGDSNGFEGFTCPRMKNVLTNATTMPMARRTPAIRYLYHPKMARIIRTSIVTADNNQLTSLLRIEPIDFPII